MDAYQCCLGPITIALGVVQEEAQAGASASSQAAGRVHQPYQGDDADVIVLALC